MDHLVENEGKPVPDLSSVTATSSSAPSGGGAGPMDVDEEDEDLAALRAVYGKQEGAGGGGSSSGTGDAAAGAEAKSIKCSVCGKTFKNVDLANYHAEKSGHDQFEESTEEVRFPFVRCCRAWRTVPVVWRRNAACWCVTLGLTRTWAD